jgi:hypothetical protein
MASVAEPQPLARTTSLTNQRNQGEKHMKFEKLNNEVLKLNSSVAAEAAATVIQTQIMGFWRNDGTDDRVPLPS